MKGKEAIKKGKNIWIVTTKYLRHFPSSLLDSLSLFPRLSSHLPIIILFCFFVFFYYSTRIGQETRPCTMHQLVIQHLNAIKCLHSLQKKDKNNMFTTFSFRSFNAVFFVFVCVLSFFFPIQSPLFFNCCYDESDHANQWCFLN